MRKKISGLVAVFTLAAASVPAQAIQFDGFMTVGAAIHDDSDNKNIYIGSLGDRGITDKLTFEADTRFGLQISSDVAENMSVVAQILGTGVNNNFNAIVEWAYVDYTFNDNVKMHVGKIKQPVYLVNDYVEVGYAYPWIRPPAEVYYQNNPLNTINGLEFLIQFPLGKGFLSLQPYIGSNRDDIPNAGGAFFEAENIFGIDVKYSGRGYVVHASTFHCDEVNTTGQIAGLDAGTLGKVDVDLNGTGQCNVSSLGLNLDLSNFVIYAEWQERTTTDTLSRPFGDQTAWYTTLGYRMGKWLPHITFATIEGKASTFGVASGQGAITPSAGNTALPAGASFNFPVALQSSITAGLRYEVNDSSALKIEYQIVDVENDPGELAKANQSVNYGLFNTDFTKRPPADNVGIISIALDVIF